MRQPPASRSTGNPFLSSTVGALLLGTLLLAIAAGAQSDAAWTPARNALGQPDMDGTWANNTATPLQRPQLLGDRETLSPEELAELQQKLQKLRDNEQAGDLLGDFLIQKVLEDPGFVGFDQDTGNYNSFWLVERELDARTSLVVDPPNGRIPAMKPAAMKRLGQSFGSEQAHNPEDFSGGTRCISYGVPNVLAGYNSYFRILQTENHVVILQELIHHARIIPIDDRPPLPENVRFWNGSSRGHWDGDTLVVETGNYLARGAYRGASEKQRVTERFTRTGPDVLEWRITFEDEDTWQTPWTMMIPLSRESEKIYEYACHEGNHSMKGILAGARTLEREAASGSSSDRR